MQVVEIFGSIEGEGKRTGQLATFVRLAGCNLRCTYCDTTYAFFGGTEMTVDDIVDACKKIGYHNVTLTGGEPLKAHDISTLIRTLCAQGFQVNVETNGSVNLSSYINMRKEENLDVFFTVDYKTLCSGMSTLMATDAFMPLDPEKDIVKCVVATEEDMDEALDYLDSFERPFNIWFSPVFGQIEPFKIVEYIKKHNRQDITIQVQLHKIIWDPMERGV